MTQIVLFYMQTTVFSTYQQQIYSIFVYVFTFIFLFPVPLLFSFLPINQHTIHYTPSLYMAPPPPYVYFSPSVMMTSTQLGEEEDVARARAGTRLCERDSVSFKA